MVCYDLAWAARTPLGFSPDGPNRAGSPGVVKELHSDTFSLPEYLGHVKDSWKGNSDKVIIHIQDAHCNYAAQKRTAEIIGYLNKEYGIDTVNLEGGARDYDLSIFTGIADKTIRDKVADYFVKEGLVNGAEYFAVNNPNKITLWGIEDTKLYLDNLKVYRDSLKYKDEVDKHLKTLTHILNNLKTKIYSQELLELDIKYSQYKAGTLEFKEYLAYLIQIARQKAIDIKVFTNIYLLSQTLVEEDKIDFKLANKERDNLIDILGKKLSKKEMEEVVLKTVEFKKELISQKDFYAYLTKRAKSINMDLKDFPELQKYIIYISMYDAIDKTMVMEEIDVLENKIKDSLCQNYKQKELSLLSKNLAILKNIFNISLTKDDYSYYKNNKDSFQIKNYILFIDKEAPFYKITAKLDMTIVNLDKYRENVEKFYEYSFKRDEAFIKNIKFHELSTMDHGQTKKTSIVVTGGFHAESLAELFKKNNISYISVMPNFNNCDGYECPYFNVLSGGMSPFEKSISTAFSLIQVASFLNDLGIKANDPRRIELLRIRAIALQSIYQTQNRIGFKLINGKYVIFDRNNGEPTCNVYDTKPDNAIILAENVVTGNANSIIHALSEIGQDRIIREAKDRTYLHDDSAVIIETRRILDSIPNSKERDVLKSALDGLLNRRSYTDESGQVQSPKNYSAIQIIGGLLAPHPGGQGIYLPRTNEFGKALTEKDHALQLIHELIAGVYAGNKDKALDSHSLAQTVENALRSNKPKGASMLLANAESYDEPIWEMPPQKRLEVDRDVAETPDENKAIAQRNADIERAISEIKNIGIPREVIRNAKNMGYTEQRIKELWEADCMLLGTSYNWGISVSGKRQKAIVVKHMRKMVSERVKENKKDEPIEFVFYNIGIGDDGPKESVEVIEAFLEAIKAEEKVLSNTKWRLISISIDIVGNIVEKSQKEFDEKNSDYQNKRLDIYMRAIKGNALDLSQLSTIFEGIGAHKKADFIFHRHCCYGNEFAAEGVIGYDAVERNEGIDFNYFSGDSRRVSNFSMALNTYLQLRNLIGVFAKKGTIYVTETVPGSVYAEIFSGKKYGGGHLAIPGSEVLSIQPEALDKDDEVWIHCGYTEQEILDFNQKQSGVYEIKNPQAMSHIGFTEFLRNLDKANSKGLEQNRFYEEYLVPNGLGDLKALIPLFTPEIRRVLIEDATLKPVFMFLLPNDKVGPLRVVDEEAVRQIGGVEILNNHSVFLVGTPEVANRLAREGKKIIVGVVDRHSTSTWYIIRVASGRQAYFSLPDGTWLGVKGSGQFLDESMPPYYADRLYNSSYAGVVAETEVKDAIDGVNALSGSRGHFVQFLGYRRIHAFLDENGNLVSPEGLKDKKGNELNPVLVFNRALDIHRLVKLPQLAAADPGLEHLSRRISQALVRFSDLPPNTMLSGSDLIYRAFGKLGRTEAIKQNGGWFKVTLHEQDFTFAGEEADNEEFFHFEGDDEELFSKCQKGLIAKLEILIPMVLSLSKDQQEILLPSPEKVAKNLLQNYFTTLDDKLLQLWAQRYEVLKNNSLLLIKGYSDDRYFLANPLIPSSTKQSIVGLSNLLPIMVSDIVQQEIGKRTQKKTLTVLAQPTLGIGDAIVFPSNSSQMKPLGLRDPMDEDAESDFSNRHSEFEDLAASVKIEAVHEAQARVVQADLGNVGAYHFNSQKYGLIIMVNSKYNEAIHEEGKFHEVRELYWMNRGFTPHEAHVIASAEQVKKFSKDGALTPYHILQLNNMSDEQLWKIMIEDERFRRWHHNVLERANSDYSADIDISRINDYERGIRLDADTIRYENRKKREAGSDVRSYVQNETSAGGGVSSEERDVDLEFSERYKKQPDNASRVEFLLEHYPMPDVKIDVESVTRGTAFSAFSAKGGGETDRISEKHYKINLPPVSDDYGGYILFHEFMHIWLEENGYTLSWDTNEADIAAYLWYLRNLVNDYLIEQECRKRFGDYYRETTKDMRDTSLREMLQSKLGKDSEDDLPILMAALTSRMAVSVYPNLSDSFSAKLINEVIDFEPFKSTGYEMAGRTIKGSGEYRELICRVHNILIGDNISDRELLQDRKISVDASHVREFTDIMHNMAKDLSNIVEIAKKSGGKMKSLGLRDPMDEDIELDFSDGHSEFETLAASASIEDVYGAQARVIQADLGNVGAYHFDSPKYGLIIVINSNNKATHEEGKFHEVRETYWKNKGFRPHQAHIIASAEQVMRFSKMGTLTPYHLLRLRHMTKEQLEAIEKEGESDRGWHHKILKDANFDYGAGIDLRVIKNYEEALRLTAGKFKIGKDVINAQIPSFTQAAIATTLDFSNENESQCAIVSINDIIRREIQNKLEPQWQPVVTFELAHSLEKDTPMDALIYGDADGESLVRLLRIILANALVYKDKGMPVVIQIKTFMGSDGNPAVSISDTGPGISLERVEKRVMEESGKMAGPGEKSFFMPAKLFDRPYLLSRIFEVYPPHEGRDIMLGGRLESVGKGQGLWAAAGIMERSKGKIIVETERYVGTKFTFVFNPANQQKQAKNVVTESSIGRKNITIPFATAKANQEALAKSLLEERDAIRELEEKDVLAVVVINDEERLKNLEGIGNVNTTGINTLAERLISNKRNSRVVYVKTIEEAATKMKGKGRTWANTFFFVEDKIRNKEKGTYDTLTNQAFVWNLNIPDNSLCNVTPLGFLLFSMKFNDLLTRIQEGSEDLDMEPLAEILLRNIGEDVTNDNIQQVIDKILKPIAERFAQDKEPVNLLKDFSGKFTWNLPKIEPKDWSEVKKYFDTMRQVYTAL